MAATTDRRPAMLSESLVTVLSEHLAFRHLFRGASMVLMRWEKLLPLLQRAGDTHDQVDTKIRAFIGFLEGDRE